MIIRRALTVSTRGMATRVPFRARKPKLGEEPRTVPTPTSTSAPSAFQAEAASQSSSPSSSSGLTPSLDEHTHFAITLHRSAIGLPDRIAQTLEALGIHRRMQTVYHRFSPDIAGKILQVKELVEVQNVAAHEVRTPEEARNARKAVRGYEIVSRARPSGMATLSQTLYAERKVV